MARSEDVPFAENGNEGLLLLGKDRIAGLDDELLRNNQATWSARLFRVMRSNLCRLAGDSLRWSKDRHWIMQFDRGST